MEDRNLVAEMVEELDDTGKFFFGLLALLLLQPQLRQYLKARELSVVAEE